MLLLHFLDEHKWLKVILDIEEVKAQASDTIFKKGEQLLAKNKVAVKSRDIHSIIAKVSGQFVYQVKLEIDNALITNAQCSCPAFSYQSICKHCVATALAFNAKDDQCLEVEDDEQKIRRFLLNKTPEQLVEQLMDFVLEDPAKYKRLLFQVEAATKIYSSSELKKLVTKALPLKNIWQYDEVLAYFQQAEAVLQVFYEHASQLPTQEYFSLLNIAFTRFDKALERVDDSAGYRFNIVEQLSEQLKDTFGQLDWSDKKKAQWIVDNIFDPFEMSITSSADFLVTDSLNAAFLECCQAEVELIEVPADFSKREHNWRLSSLIQPLLNQAVNNGDVHKQAKLLAIQATDIKDLIEISKLYLEHDDEFNAEDWLLKANKLPARSHEKKELQQLQIRVDVALGKKEQAWVIAWQCFITEPSFQGYLQLERHILLTGSFDPDYLSKVEQGLLKKPGKQGNAYHSDAALEYYLHHNHLAKAAHWANSHEVDCYLLMKLALRIVDSEPKQAIVFCQRSISHMVILGTNQVYAEAISYLSKFVTLWNDRAQEQGLLKILIKDLYLKFKAKRNFIKLLDEQFSEYL
ncbi:MAG: SWIM zinc finger family protein [Oceanospirillaceae bacterium]|nr:SWIM zinc finger family protein [Oceanospirillaceae bacterium]